MASKYRIRLGDYVHYLSASPRVTWKVVKVTSITDQNNLVLAIVNEDGTRTALNGGSAVARRTTDTQTNVWRPH